MKLIREVNDQIQVLTEETKTGSKNYFIEGIFLQSDIQNRNGRVYPAQIMDEQVDKYTKAFIDEGRALGELGHPEGPTINLERASHKILSLRKEGTDYVGKAKVMDTPYGKIVKNLIDEGVKLGVSSRGLGSLEERNGVNYVRDDFVIATAADIVADPSAPAAFVRGIMESSDWIYIEGKGWIERFVANAKKELNKTPVRKFDEKAVKLFETYLKNLAKNSV